MSTSALNPTELPEHAWPEATFTHTIKGWEVYYYRFEVDRWTATAVSLHGRIQLSVWSRSQVSTESRIRRAISATIAQLEN